MEKSDYIWIGIMIFTIILAIAEDDYYERHHMIGFGRYYEDEQ